MGHCQRLKLSADVADAYDGIDGMSMCHVYTCVLLNPKCFVLIQSWAAGLPAGRVRRTELSAICNGDASVTVREVVVDKDPMVASGGPDWHTLAEQPDGLPILAPTFKKNIEACFPGLEFEWKLLFHSGKCSMLGRSYPVQCMKYSLGVAITPHSPPARPIAMKFGDD